MCVKFFEKSSNSKVFSWVGMGQFFMPNILKSAIFFVKKDYFWKISEGDLANFWSIIPVARDYSLLLLIHTKDTLSHTPIHKVWIPKNSTCCRRTFWKEYHKHWRFCSENIRTWVGYLKKKNIKFWYLVWLWAQVFGTWMVLITN